MSAGPRPSSAAQRSAARDAVLLQCIEAFRMPEVSAMHLLGSLARNAGDDLSDIDLWITVDDAAVAHVAQERRTRYAAIAPVLIVHETARNRPVGGVYSLVIHETTAGLMHVDYYLAPRSSSVLLPEARLICGDDALPRGDWRLDVDAAPYISASERIDFLICMGFIGVKMARRGDARFMRFLAGEYRAIVDAFGLGIAAEVTGEDTSFLMEMFRQLGDVASASQRHVIDRIVVRHLPLAAGPG